MSQSMMEEIKGLITDLRYDFSAQVCHGGNTCQCNVDRLTLTCIYEKKRTESAQTITSLTLTNTHKHYINMFISLHWGM